MRDIDMVKQGCVKHGCTVGTPELLVALQAESLDADTTIRLDRHVAGCAACQEFLGAQRQVWEALDAFGQAVPPVSARFDAQLYARIASEQSGSWWQRTWRRWFESGEPVNWKPAGALAFACLAVTVGLAVQSKSPSAISKPKPVEIAFSANEIQQIETALEDFEMLDKMGAPQEEK